MDWRLLYRSLLYKVRLFSLTPFILETDCDGVLNRIGIG